MGFHLPLRPRPQPVAIRVRVDADRRDAREVLAADWADAALSLSIAQARYRAAIDRTADAATLTAVTSDLMRARTRLEALRRAALPETLLPAG